MAQERPNRMVELVTLLRKNGPIAVGHVKEWFEEVRREPRLLWETPAVRYAAYGMGALILSWILLLAVRLMTPPPPPGARDPAVTADFRVVCSDPACGFNFVIQRKFGFDDFPVTCVQCKKETGVSGRRCYSPKCQGRWVAPSAVEPGKIVCPRCGTAFP